jgi:hypothetical protein
MATVYKTYRKIKKLFLVALLTLLLAPNILTSQAYTSQRIELSEAAMKNFQIGLKSDNDGIKMSLIYFTGKYKIRELSPNLLEVVQNSNNEEICQMAIWSLYQIGDDSSCIKLQELLEIHPSEKIREYCQFLESIRKYENSLAIIDR